MFGYIKVYKPEMKFKEYETYRGVYCSLCNQLGKNYGLVSKLTLNYDFTFLALLKLSTKKDNPCFENKRCPFNPTKKCSNCSNSDSEFTFATSVAMLMLYYKLLDNISDEKFFKRILSKTLIKIYKKKYNKALSLYPKVDDIMKDMTVKQANVESQKLSIDAYAHPSAEALGLIFSYDENDENEKKVLYRLGYCLGRYVYFMDALDDYNSDIKNNSFNAFKICDNVEKSEEIINHSIGEAINALNLLRIKRYNGILENILCYGLTNNLNIVLEKREV